MDILKTTFFPAPATNPSKMKVGTINLQLSKDYGSVCVFKSDIWNWLENFIPQIWGKLFNKDTN